MAHSLHHTERSIHEMLKDTPPMNESGSAIHSGTEGRAFMPPNSLPLHNHSAPATPCHKQALRMVLMLACCVREHRKLTV
ncbi:unnamed protein product [Ceratitis capitata]|uniref:(Mediterranean fruit fly) hypothetical protein n=1 Tax=Ceratitis capitata TaxID=7213 RepID=A0A811TYQ7_CERCA|nr:unnamed protein product [Ceratitis capitata]